MASASAVLISCYIKAGTWSLLWAACGATSPWAEAQQQPAPVVKWLLITQERIAPNHFLSTAHFHETQNSHTLLCNSSLGFCEWSFVVTSAALGGMQGSAFACSFSFPSFSFPVYIHGVVLLQTTKVPWHLQSGNCWFLQRVSVGFRRPDGNCWNSTWS